MSAEIFQRRAVEVKPSPADSSESAAYGINYSIASPIAVGVFNLLNFKFPLRRWLRSVRSSAILYNSATQNYTSTYRHWVMMRRISPANAPMMQPWPGNTTFTAPAIDAPYQIKFFYPAEQPLIVTFDRGEIEVNPNSSYSIDFQSNNDVPAAGTTLEINQIWTFWV